jgi:hypothetical protein
VFYKYQLTGSPVFFNDDLISVNFQTLSDLSRVPVVASHFNGSFSDVIVAPASYYPEALEDISALNHCTARCVHLAPAISGFRIYARNPHKNA